MSGQRPDGVYVSRKSLRTRSPRRPTAGVIFAVRPPACLPGHRGGRTHLVRRGGRATRLSRTARAPSAALSWNLKGHPPPDRPLPGSGTRIARVTQPCGGQRAQGFRLRSAHSTCTADAVAWNPCHGIHANGMMPWIHCGRKVENDQVENDTSIFCVVPGS